VTPLLRYWLLPGRFRRLPIAAQAASAALALLITAGVSAAILRGRIAQTAFTPATLAAMILFIGTPSILCIAGMLAGATLIAAERQKQTWDSLLLVPIPVARLICLKLAARLAYCFALATPLVVWLVCCLYRLVFDSGIFSDGPAPSPAMRRLRVAIFLTWSGLDVIARLLPAVLLGAAISARCRKVNDALLICFALLAGYAVLFWQMLTTLHVPSVLESASPVMAVELFRWPALPYLSGEYPGVRMLLPTGWQNNVVADLIWVVVVPLLLLVPTITWSRLPRRAAPSHTLPARH
jgi:ABC-type Na+ efflux pump permease subunit